MYFLKKTGRRFLNNKGSSLAELMVSSAVSIVVSTVASFAFLMAFDVYLRMIRQYEAEVEMSSLMYSLRSTMVTAVNVTYGGQASAANNAVSFRGTGQGAGGGQIYSMTDGTNAANINTYDGSSFVFGFFNRNMGQFSSTESNLSAVQMVYKRPLSGAAGGSGEVFIDLEKNAAGAGGWVRARPINSPLLFTRLTSFEIDNIKVYDNDGSLQNVVNAGGTPCLGGTNNCVGRPVASAEIKVVMRYFTRGLESNWRWCNSIYASAYGACTINNVTYYDVERKMTVVFANNSFQPTQYLPRRPLGNLFFMNPWKRISL